MKKIQKFILLFTMLGSLSLSSYADSFPLSNSDSMLDVTPKWTISCPSGNKHNARNMGIADIRSNGKLVWVSKNIYQCSYCYICIIPETPINLREPVGYYYEVSFDMPVDGGKSVIEVSTPRHYESRYYLDGYEFEL